MDETSEKERDPASTTDTPPPRNSTTKRSNFKMAGPLGLAPAKATLEKAAAAVDLTLDQLANLVVDSGVLAALPQDGLTEQFSLADLGNHLTVSMGQMAKTARPTWFKGLSPVQKAAIVVHLRVNGCSVHAVSQEFVVHPDKVQNIYNEYVDKVGQNTTNVRLTMIVGQMTIVAERAQQGAMQKDDWGTYWRIQKELIANLQSLGVVDKAAHRVEVTHGLADRAKENIERLASLRMKQHARQREISVVSSETTDAVPKEFVDE